MKYLGLVHMLSVLNFISLMIVKASALIKVAHYCDDIRGDSQKWTGD